LMAQKIGAVNLRIGYGLELVEAHKWGLYISASAEKAPLGLSNLNCSPSPESFFYGRTSRSTTSRYNRCPLFGRTSTRWSRPWTSSSIRTIRREVCTRGW
jgi:hypothetical protein